MRDVGLRKIVLESIRAAVVAREEEVYNAARKEALNKFLETGYEHDEETSPLEFDQEAAETMGLELAQRATSREPAEFAAACEEIDAMGLSVVDLMGKAWSNMVAWPTDFRTYDFVDGISWDPTQHILDLNTGLKEWVGLLAYRLTGRLPSPEAKCASRT